MAHSRIFQITREKIEDKEDYINSEFYDPALYSHFADYIEDVENEQDSLEWLDEKFKGLFVRNGRELILLDISEFMDEFRTEIVKSAENLDMRDWLTCYKLRKVQRCTHINCDFYINQEVYNTTPVSFGMFIQDVYQNHKPGDKFYIGGILDYHF